MKITNTMKKIIVLLGILVSITAARSVFAQVSEGIITYEVKVNMHRTLPPDRQEMKNMIPEFRTSKDQLFFNASESLHKPMEEEEDEESEEGGVVRMRMRRPQNEYFVNQGESRRTILQEFMGKKYIIEDSLKVTPWKFGTETKEIKGYSCKQAVYFNEERKQTIVAWYTEKLRPFLGPETFNTLPGTVLMVDINDGERTITATEIKAGAVKKTDLKMSGGGVRTTEAEFRKIREEQMERMRANGATVIIR
jgi:GLPGLI family protein